ncbi:hypothetical protein BYT27DRAFT_7237245 [Phlegmacium glaucopus]|nr:hypothetical protein BYT27DRAFT_7237245 [Phlegmacium glaucopus]
MAFSPQSRILSTEYLQKFVVIALTFWPAAVVGGGHFSTCFSNLNVSNGSHDYGPTGGVDNHGHPVNLSVATGMTYELCNKACGVRQGPPNWIAFSRQFGLWLLPWLGLLSQLPFGANDNLDNLSSMLLTVGSPTLAAYSLALTVFNRSWIARRFAGYTYPNVRNAVRILSSLQQSSLEIETKGGLLASLVVLPENDKWWSELIESIDVTHTWSTPAITSIAWVVLAYVFTLIDAHSEGILYYTNDNGPSLGSLWLWLLPIVIGWLQVSPKCDSIRLRRIIERANEIAYVATDGGCAVHVKDAKIEARAIELTMTGVDYLRRDEICTVPIYNYARFLPWVQAVEKVSAAFEAASDRYHNNQSVNHSIDWVTVEHGDKPNEINRVGNTMQVEEYCILQHNRRRRSRWGPEILSRIFVASVLALMLQWGTAGALVIAVWFTPTRGLGCRSASYLVYAVLSTVVWMLLVTSSILTHYYTARRHDDRVIHHWSTRAAKYFSITFRCLGKVIAASNAIWLVLSGLLHFTNSFNTCYCNSNILWLPQDRAYVVMWLSPDDVVLIKVAWVVSVCMAAASAVLYIQFINYILYRSKK